VKYFYPKLHSFHKPSIDLSDGLPGYKHLEVASRIDEILKGLLSAFETEVVYVKKFGDTEIRTIHDDDYVEFLLSISKEIKDEEEYIPPIFRKDLMSAPLYFRGGMYCTEIGTPIGKDSVKAGLNSAQTTLEATKYVLEDNDAFVLTRPPGHHAGKSRYGGYSFFNNAYLAANELNKNGQKVAVVDIDYHIGDGSLEFANKEIPYFSLHSNPFKNYPYLEADFINSNPYVTLEEFKTGINGDAYVNEIKNLLDKVVVINADIIILSLGFDTLETDYCQDEYIYVKPIHFKEIGELLGGLKQKVLILLEGGYDIENLELCAKNFMLGFVKKKGI